MASSKPLSSAALFLCLNLLFFTTMVSSTCQTEPACPFDYHNLKNQGCSYLKPSQCCGLLQGLVDLEAAVCICAALKLDLLGAIPVTLDAAITLILGTCGKTKPVCFNCI
ncbi:hypothetical protein L6164_032341 [Bauhinia variegata]|uniref:Uncharacterized protein n=1 Tax=Bauhinia variegata TaxID=167791 RepID=A0ACB9KNC7_BAUVA|nr:hypothetical protein L6164_032341 [Bauhinia variegata]